ncbi:MAG TPA: hypothetical protein PK562_06210, partial [Candidatus Omnitrophota bacterium]|nr:hypothetical protein [Candidatus Omnitrophota bacterium]
SKDPVLGVELQYVSGWKVSEQRGSGGSFMQAVFLEPRAKNDTSKGAAMVVTSESASKVKAASLEAFVEDFVSRRMKFADAKIVSRTKARVGGLEASDILLTYRSVDKLYSVDSKPVSFTERALVVKKGVSFYTIRYENNSASFGRFEKAFEHMVRTVRFKSGS